MGSKNIIFTIKEWKNMKKICRKCNKIYEENVKLCEVCGGELEEDLDKLQTDVVIKQFQ